VLVGAESAYAAEGLVKAPFDAGPEDGAGAGAGVFARTDPRVAGVVAGVVVEDVFTAVCRPAVAPRSTNPGPATFFNQHFFVEASYVNCLQAGSLAHLLKHAETLAIAVRLCAFGSFGREKFGQSKVNPPDGGGRVP